MSNTNNTTNNNPYQFFNLTSLTNHAADRRAPSVDAYLMSNSLYDKLNDLQLVLPPKNGGREDK